MRASSLGVFNFSTAALSLTLVAGCVGQVDPIDADSADEALISGTVVSSVEARSSGVVTLSQVGAAYSCTGVLVSDSWVLTDSHCFLGVVDADNNGEADGSFPSRISVRLGNPSDTGAQVRTASRIVRHPTGAFSSSFKTIPTALDVALVKVASPFDVTGLVPYHFVGGRLTIAQLSNAQLAGAMLTTLGYGCGQLDSRYLPVGPYQLRSSMNEASLVSSNAYQFTTNAPNLAGMTCDGDFGGPVFLEVKGPNGATPKTIARYLVGISRGYEFSGSSGSNFVTAASAFRDWIKSIVSGYDSNLTTTCWSSNSCGMSPTPIANNTNWLGAFVPRGADEDLCYFARISYSLEANRDYATIAGTRVTGSGYMQTHYCGALPIAVNTDGASPSSGVTISTDSAFSRASSNQSCSGATSGWVGCRGNGCSVCTELTTQYPRYFINHTSCTPNLFCGGTSYMGSCSSSCPAPTDSDR